QDTPASPDSSESHTVNPNITSLTLLFSFFFFNAPAPTEIYTLSLHDALPISHERATLEEVVKARNVAMAAQGHGDVARLDRKSTRLNSSHGYSSYAVFCL